MIERNEAIARIKKALKARSGKTWSVTGNKGTAWGWINIDAPPARRTWRFTIRDDHGCVICEEVNDPSAKFGHMSQVERKELAELLGVEFVHHQGQSVSPDSRAYFVDAAENKGPAEAMKCFAGACESFQTDVKSLAAKHGKTVEQVYVWWREYAAICSSGDQSAIWFEFLQWYAAKLGEPVPEFAEECRVLGIVG
jgi:hypothetical protein